VRALIRPDDRNAVRLSPHSVIREDVPDAQLRVGDYYIDALSPCYISTLAIAINAMACQRADD
jgi:hypothetical protein